MKNRYTQNWSLVIGHWSLTLLICLLPFLGQAQTAADTTTSGIKKGRLALVTGTATTMYGSSLGILYKYWYANSNLTAFHYFNDEDEWLQMDKVGHSITSYYEGEFGYRVLRWAGLPRKKAIWIGGSIGMIMQTPLEVLDGFSSAWGFSWTDMGANAFGSALFISQALAWDEQRIQLKYSFTPSKYAALSPNLLGSGIHEQLLKDYNAQTYWLSINPRSFMKKGSFWPIWLNVAAGYGGDGMLRGTAKDQYEGDIQFPYYKRVRQYYLSLDVDWNRIPVRSKVLRRFFTIIAFVKFPAPALEYNTNQSFKFHLIYF